MPDETRRVPVEVHDPELSDRANALLTEQTRAALGRDEVDLPVDRAERAGRTHPRSEGILGAIWERRMLAGVTLGVALVLAGILSLTTGSWWWLPLAVILHGVATFLVTVVIIRSTTAVEAPDPSVAVELEQEGVRDPEVELTAQVRSFSPEDRSNVRDAKAEDAPEQAAEEQGSAMTPSAEDSDPAGAGTPEREERERGR